MSPEDKAKWGGQLGSVVGTVVGLFVLISIGAVLTWVGTMDVSYWVVLACGVLIGLLFGFRKGHTAGQNFAARMLDDQVLKPARNRDGGLQ